MISTGKNTSSAIVQKSFIMCVLFGLALVILGWLLVPTTSLLSIAGACLVLVVYGLAGYFSFPRIRSEILIIVGVFGLLAGAIFAGEILLEYAILPADNTSWGVIEFGCVFALYFLSSVVVAYRRKGIRVGIVAAVVTAMLSSVVWLIFALLAFYIFRGTTRQEHVFMAEGNFEDFARSGVSDFNAFVMEDFFGAGFFHLLLGPIIAAILGTIGGLSGKGLARIRKQ
jgi:hypothetical protein